MNLPDWDFDLDEPLYAEFEVAQLGATTGGRRLHKTEERAALQAFAVIATFEDRAQLADRARRGDDRIHFERERFVRLLLHRERRGGARG